VPRVVARTHAIARTTAEARPGGPQNSDPPSRHESTRSLVASTFFPHTQRPRHRRRSAPL